MLPTSGTVHLLAHTIYSRAALLNCELAPTHGLLGKMHTGKEYRYQSHTARTGLPTVLL